VGVGACHTAIFLPPIPTLNHQSFILKFKSIYLLFTNFEFPLILHIDII